MPEILPGLFSVPTDITEQGKEIFLAIKAPVHTTSLLLRNPRLNDHEKSDLSRYWQDLLKTMGPLSAIVDRRTDVPTPTRTWQCAYQARQAVWRVYELLKSLFDEFNETYVRYNPRRHLKRTLNHLAEIRETFEEERLILDLGKSVAEEFPGATPRRRKLPARTAPPKKGGRPRSEDVEEVQSYLYKRWIKGDKLAAIRTGAQAKFGEKRSPKEDSHVTREAKRYAQKNDLPTERKK